VRTSGLRIAKSPKLSILSRRIHKWTGTRILGVVKSWDLALFTDNSSTCMHHGVFLGYEPFPSETASLLWHEYILFFLFRLH